MKKSDIDSRLEKATELIISIRIAENVLDKLFFSKPTISVPPPPINFFHNYIENAYHAVSEAKDQHSGYSENRHIIHNSSFLSEPREPFTESEATFNKQQIEYPDNFGEMIGNRIRHVRTKRGITQNELATLTGIRRPNIARLEKGHSLPNLATLIKVSSALHYPLQNLLHWEPGNT